VAIERQGLDGNIMNNYVVEAKKLTKIYDMGEVKVHALRGLSLKIKPGEIVAIMGPSGSGKSTLMNTLGCLDRPTSGEYILNGERTSNLSDDELAIIRNRQVGFIFQNYNLLPRASALTNVQLPLIYTDNGVNDMERIGTEILKAVGLGDRLHHRPYELSGGQQQRVAIARALINKPAIVLADEPTGNLDSRSGEEIMQLLLKLNRERGVTLIIVTHDTRVAAHTQRVIHILDGKVSDTNENR
jgi:putative ABC transport system ATP-binding protein